LLNGVLPFKIFGYLQQPMMSTVKKQNWGEKAVPILQASKMGSLNNCGGMDQAIGALNKINAGESGKFEYTI
jgi:hypothetical protein